MPTSTHSSPDSESPGRPPTVVVVDDDPQTLAALRRTLRKEPYRLLTSSNPRQVLDWVDDLEVSVVLSDHRMPLIEGIELLREVRLRSPRTRGLILTAFPGSLRLDLGLLSWVGRVIPKPWEDEGLRSVLRELLGAGPGAPSDPVQTPGELDFDLGGEA